MDKWLGFLSKRTLDLLRDVTRIFHNICNILLLRKIHCYGYQSWTMMYITQIHVQDIIDNHTERNLLVLGSKGDLKKMNSCFPLSKYQAQSP